MADGTGFLHRERPVDALTINPGLDQFRAGISEEPYVGLVDEPDVVRHPVHPFPVYGHDGRHCPISGWFRPELRYLRHRGGCLPLDRVVTEQALLNRGDRRILSLGDVAMAELTLYAHVAFFNCTGVDRVRKGDRLWRSVAQSKRRIGEP